ncbi:MAG: DUF975 family protein [Ruminococcaceae bacterium]|nr:DUF975 family protein [Oscillospiraceae bacterium]
MNGKIKIFSKANMLDQNLKMTLVLIITVLFSIFFNNTFILGEIICRLPPVSQFSSPLMRMIFLVFLGVVSYVAILPFNYGRDIWFYENAKKNKLSLKKLFFYYSIKKSSGAIKILFSVQIRKLLATLLFLVPSIAVGAYLIYALRDGIGELMMLSLAVSFFLLLLTGLFFSFVYCQKYILAPYLFYENEGCSAREIISFSSKIMENKCFDTAMFKLSFFPWYLLYILVFPAVYVYPYYKTSISFKVLSLLTK